PTQEAAFFAANRGKNQRVFPLGQRLLASRETSGDVSAQPRGDSARYRLTSAEVLLHALLILFAADAERGLRAGLEALHRDLFAALLARAEAPVLDLGQG